MRFSVPRLLFIVFIVIRRPLEYHVLCSSHLFPCVSLAQIIFAFWTAVRIESQILFTSCSSPNTYISPVLLLTLIDALRLSFLVLMRFFPVCILGCWSGRGDKIDIWLWDNKANSPHLPFLHYGIFQGKIHSCQKKFIVICHRKTWWQIFFPFVPLWKTSQRAIWIYVCLLFVEIFAIQYYELYGPGKTGK